MKRGRSNTCVEKDFGGSVTVVEEEAVLTQETHYDSDSDVQIPSEDLIRIAGYVARGDIVSLGQENLHLMRLDLLHLEDGNNLFHVAVINGQLEILEYLHSFDTYSPNPNHVNNNGHTPLTLAIQSEYAVEMVSRLLEYGANPRFTGEREEWAMLLAVKLGKLDLLKLLCNAIKNEVIKRNEICRENIIKTTLEAKLTLELKKHREALEKAIVKAMSQEDNLGNSILHHAAMRVTPEAVSIVEFLIEQQGMEPFSVNKIGNTALHVAVINGNIPVIVALLRYYPPHNMQNFDGNTPLHLAVINGNIEAARLLILYGENPDSFNYLSPSDIATEEMRAMLRETRALTGDELQDFLDEKEFEDESLNVKPSGEPTSFPNAVSVSMPIGGENATVLSSMYAVGSIGDAPAVSGCCYDLDGSASSFL